LIPAKCYVIRSGKTELCDAKGLVYGDIVYLRSGDKVPADLVLFASTDCKVDNSSLTGEAEPQLRGPANSQKNPLEAHNLCFNGTLCVNGEGYGIVVRTGDNTVIGKIAFLTSTEDKRESPMNQEINNFVYTIASVAAVVAITFFTVSLVKGNSVASSLNFAIGTFVSFVPEGLPATVTILLSLSAKRMAARNVLVKDLQGVETLGAITLLATDKTGTLTRNQMTVTYAWSGGTLYFAQIQAGNDPSAIMLDLSDPAPNEIMHISLLCSKARFENNEGPISTRPVLGDATEAGLLRIAAQKLENFENMHDTYPKVFEIPFNSENKWAMTIHKKKHANGSLMLYLKGAPERVLRICSTFHDGSKVVPLTEKHKSDFDKMYNFLASKGHRVLAFAALTLPGDQYPENFQFTKDPDNYPKVKDIFFITNFFPD
jgi:sodium/potassium-transporting ATPase subunit alpha